MKLGVKFFQGFYFERPTSIAAKLANPAYATVIQLINLVRSEADAVTIEALLKRDPTLSFKLLRYINSAGFGLGCEVTSFRHAVMILGLKKLFRWAALLLTSIKSSSAPPVVAGFAVTRARFMELLAAECLPPEDCDNAFLAGVFSLLDVMLGVPMEKALASLTIEPARLLGIEARVGSLESGKDGDIAIYDGDPLEYTTHCVGTFIGGVRVSDIKR